MRGSDQVADVHFLVGVIDRDPIRKPHRIEPLLQFGPAGIQVAEELLLPLGIESRHAGYDTLPLTGGLEDVLTHPARPDC